MNASSTAILQAGVDGVTGMFIALLAFALTNWIPIVLSITVVVGIVAFLFAKAKGLFGAK